MPGGAAARIVGSSSLSCLTIVSVEAPPFLITVSSAERRPSWRTMFVCTAKPSRTWATSRTYTTAPLTYFTGRSEEHTSELQSPYDLVCRLLLEKKKTKIIHT